MINFSQVKRRSLSVALLVKMILPVIPTGFISAFPLFRSIGTATEKQALGYQIEVFSPFE